MRRLHFVCSTAIILAFLLSCEEPAEAPKEVNLQDQVVNKSWTSQYTFTGNEQEDCTEKIEKLTFNKDGTYEMILTTGSINGTYQITEDKYIHFDSKFVDAQTKDEISFQSKWQITGIYPTTMHIYVEFYTNFSKLNCHGFVFTALHN